MAEKANYVREPLMAAKEAFGDNIAHLKNKEEVAEMLGKLKAEKRLTINTAGVSLIGTPYATEILAALLKDQANCLNELWLLPNNQRQLLGFMLEIEKGAINAVLRLTDHGNDEWYRERLASLEKFDTLLTEAQKSGGEIK